MAANFPGTPTIGDTVTIENVTYRWTGTTWTIVSGGIVTAVVQSNNGTIDLSKGNYHKIYASGNASVTVSFTNVSSGSSKWFLELHVSASYTITWPASVIWEADTAPATVAYRNVILEFYTPDGGTTVYGIESMNASGFGLGSWDISYAAADNSFVASYGNIHDAVFLREISVTDQDTSPEGLFFRSDGLKLYILGNAGNDVNEYDLGTAWNISTASFVQIFSVAGQETNPHGIFFKSDGTKMYVVGFASDDVNEYNLSTAWNVSTASFVRNYALSGPGSRPVDIFFKPDGSKMYILGQDKNTVYVHNVAA